MSLAEVPFHANSNNVILKGCNHSYGLNAAAKTTRNQARRLWNVVQMALDACTPLRSWLQAIAALNTMSFVVGLSLQGLAGSQALQTTWTRLRSTYTEA